MKKVIFLLAIVTMALAAQAQDFGRSNNRDNRPQRSASAVLTSAQFKQLLQAIKSEPFKDDKVRVFRLGVNYNMLNTAQVAELLKQFAFNDDKLLWAKLAYPYTADKQHFYLLRDQLTFTSIQREFDDFLLAESSNRPGRYTQLLTKTEYAELKASIARQPFNDDKMKVFRLAMQRRMITTAQVRDLLLQFTFDDDKLKWAMLAYDYTADVTRFYQLRDLFTFDINKRKLDDFLLGQG